MRASRVIRSDAITRITYMLASGKPKVTPAPELEGAADSELLVLLAQRRSDAFDELYRRHAPAVTAAMRRLLSDSELAAEVTQVAFMRLWDRYADDGRGRLRAWLVRVAHNAAIDRLRVKSVSTLPLTEAVERAAESLGPDEEVIMKERKNDVRAALRALPNVQRDAIELSYFGGLSQSDIAQITGEPLGTVKGRIRLGMQRLRALMTTSGEPA
jgi:RNA polymerase sigma-70 factor, ECF subfamily